MDEKTVELIGIGAAYAAGCEPCLVYHIKRALELNVPAEEIQRAISIAQKTNDVSIERKNKLVERFLKEAV
jgi:AhpD family alkylhydroperoxidase